jgi:hypothetical protein
MEVPDTQIDRILQEVSRLRERVDSIPTMAELVGAIFVGSLAVMAYNYIAMAYNYLAK